MSELDYDDKIELRDDSKQSLTKETRLTHKIGMGEVFETVPRNEFRLIAMGEICTAQGFSATPICVHYVFDLPMGWRNDTLSSTLQGTSHSCNADKNGNVNLSQPFFAQLTFSMDSLSENETYTRPIILLVVLSLDGQRVRNEGYAYISIPSTPGHHSITVQTWKPAPRTIYEQMQDLFLDAPPALQDIKAVHIPPCDSENSRRPNRLGLKTIPSGKIKIRIHVIHQSHSLTSSLLQDGKINLLERMSSTTILKGVQAVIDAFQRARKKAEEHKHL